MSDKKLLTKAVIIGTACGLLVCVILLCVCSAIMLTSGLMPAEVTDYMMLAVVFFGALSCAFITARITKSAGLIVGVMTGFAIFLFITVSGLIKSSETVSIITLIRFAVTVIGGAAGGALGVNKKDKIHIK